MCNRMLQIYIFALRCPVLIKVLMDDMGRDIIYFLIVLTTANTKHGTTTS